MTPEAIVAAAILFGLITAIAYARRAASGDPEHQLLPSWPVLLAACLLAALVVQNLIAGSLLWVTIDALLLAFLVLYIVTGRNRAA